MKLYWDPMKVNRNPLLNYRDRTTVNRKPIKMNRNINKLETTRVTSHRNPIKTRRNLSKSIGTNRPSKQ